jgi:hypothetical protein
LLPPLILWILIVKFRWPAFKSFAVGYISAGLVLFNINSIIPSVNPLKTITDKQAAFLMLPVAATQISIDTLHPNFKSFAMNAPQAYNHLLLRPYPFELPAKSLLPINIELIGYQLLFILFLFFKRKKLEGEDNPFILFGVIFTLTMFLFIGYIMPNLGSLIRYRSIYLIFLVTPMLCRIDWVKVTGLFKLKK